MPMCPLSPLPTCEVLVEGTLAPGQGILEGVEEVPEYPGHDGVVEQRHQERNQHRGNTCTDYFCKKTKSNRKRGFHSSD